MTDESSPVTQETCRTKHKVLGWGIAAVGIFAGVAFVLPLWALDESREATKAAAGVAKDFGEHAAAQESHEDHLDKSLERIYQTQVRILDKVDRIEKAVNGK